MTDRAPLTDDELAAMEWVFPPPQEVGTGIGFFGVRTIDRDAYERAVRNVPRLIADLRAARAEVERLRRLGCSPHTGPNAQAPLRRKPKPPTIWHQPLVHDQPLLSAAEWKVIGLALETQERVMLERGADQAAEIAHALREKLR